MIRVRPFLFILGALFAVASAHAVQPASPAPNAGATLATPPGNDGVPSAPIASQGRERLSRRHRRRGLGRRRGHGSERAGRVGRRAPVVRRTEPLSQRVASYDLKATLDPDKHTVEGKEHLRWLNRSDRPISSLYFHLYLNGFEGPGSTWLIEKARYGAFRSGVETKKGEWGFIEVKTVAQNGKPASFVYVHPDGGPETDHTVMRVDLPDAIAPGATGEVDLEFHDQLPRVIARTGYFQQYHLDRAVVSEGRRPRAARRTRRHGAPVELPRVPPEQRVLRRLRQLPRRADRAEGLPGPRDRRGARRAARRRRRAHAHLRPGRRPRLRLDRVERLRASRSKGAYDGAGSPHVDMEVLYPAEYEQAARDALEGDGRFAEVLLRDARAVSVSPRHRASCLPSTPASREGWSTRRSSPAARSGPRRDLTRFVTVHEFGHGYFMGLLATNEFEEPFLDEGMNEFWDGRMLAPERVQFRLAAAFAFLGVRRPPSPTRTSRRSRGARTRFQADPIAGNSWDRFSEGSYGLVYPRTVLVFHDLEKLPRRGRARPRHEALLQALAPPPPVHRRPAPGADRRRAGKPGLDQRLVRARGLPQRAGRRSRRDRRGDRGRADGRDERRRRQARREGRRTDVEKEIEAARKAWKTAHPGERAGGPYPFRSEVDGTPVRGPRAPAGDGHLRRRQHARP